MTDKNTREPRVAEGEGAKRQERRPLWDDKDVTTQKDIDRDTYPAERATDPAPLAPASA